MFCLKLRALSLAAGTLLLTALGTSQVSFADSPPGSPASSATAPVIVASPVVLSTPPSAANPSPSPTPPRSVAERQADEEKKAPGDVTARDLYREAVPGQHLADIGVISPTGQLNSNGVRPFYTFFDRVFIFIGGHSFNDIMHGGLQPAFKHEIDSTIHNPWLLNNDTARWRDQFGHNGEKYTAAVMATTLPGMAVYSPERAHRDPALSPYTSDDAIGIAKNVGTRILGDLDPAQMIDYGVHRLGSTSFFPQTQPGWEGTKDKIAEYAAPIAVSAFVVGGLANLGTFSFGGNPIQIDKGEYNIGWRASVRHFGFSLTPALRAGPAFTTAKGYELSGGVVQYVNAPTGSEKTGIEIFGKVPLVRPGRDTQWDVGVISNGHYYMVDDNPKEQGVFRLSTDLYFKRPDFLNTGRLDQLVGDVNFSTNMTSQSALTTSIGISDFTSGTTFAAYGRLAHDNNDPLGNAAVFGFFISGSLEPHTAIVQGTMKLDAERVLRAFERLKKLEEEHSKCVGVLQLTRKPAAPGAQPAPYAKNTEIKECLESEKTLADARKELRREFTDFLEQRTSFFMHEGKESRNAITDYDGPLQYSVMKQIRDKIGLPEYAAANFGESDRIPVSSEDPNVKTKVVTVTVSKPGAQPAPTPADPVKKPAQ